jgi:hypothetical protein
LSAANQRHAAHWTLMTLCLPSTCRHRRPCQWRRRWENIRGTTALQNQVYMQAEERWQVMPLRKRALCRRHREQAWNVLLLPKPRRLKPSHNRKASESEEVGE